MVSKDTGAILETISTRLLALASKIAWCLSVAAHPLA